MFARVRACSDRSIAWSLHGVGDGGWVLVGKGFAATRRPLRSFGESGPSSAAAAIVDPSDSTVA